MKKIISFLILMAFALTSIPIMEAAAKSTSVKGYKKKNGTYVRSYQKNTPSKYKKRKK